MRTGKILAGNRKKMLYIRLLGVTSWSVVSQHRLRKGEVSGDPCAASTAK